MKKQLIIMIFVMLFCFPSDSKALATNSSNYNRKVYFFYEEDCKDCDKGKKWLEEELKSHGRIQVEYIDIDSDEEFYTEVRDTFHMKSKKVPLIVIGSHSFVGFSNQIQSNFVEAMKAYEEAEEYCDALVKVRNHEEVEDCIKRNQETYHIPKKVPGFIKVIGIFGVCLFLFGIAYIMKQKRQGKSRRYKGFRNF